MFESFLLWGEHHETLIAWVAGASLIMFFGSLLALPYLATLIPADYFSNDARARSALPRCHPLLHVALRILRNLVGWVLVLAGIAMLVLPGQGLLTIFVGLIMSEFPGKYRLERRLASMPRLLRALNWLRQLRNCPPLQPPAGE